MQRSTDGMLTTHAGSLPKPSDLDAMLRAKEAGQPYIAEAVQQQAEHGLDIADEAFLPAVAVGTVEHWLRKASLVISTIASTASSVSQSRRDK